VVRTKKPRKISPLSEMLNVTQRTMITGQNNAQPVNPAMIISHNLIEYGSSEGNENGTDGGSGRISEMVRNGMERVKNVNPYVVQQVIRDKAEGRSKMCLPTRLWSGY